jgi:DNA gyrase subunit A
MGSRKGVIKKTALSAFSNPRAGVIIAMGVEQDDAVITVQGTDGTGEIFIGTRKGMAIRFPEADVRPMGRTAYGVRGITLRENDYVVAMEVVKPGGTLLTVTERGYGKRTEIEEYRVQSRGGVGVINISTSERNGEVVGVAHAGGRRTAGDYAAGHDHPDAHQRCSCDRTCHPGRAPHRGRGRRQGRLARAPAREGRRGG